MHLHFVAFFIFFLLNKSNSQSSVYCNETYQCVNQTYNNGNYLDLYSGGYKANEGIGSYINTVFDVYCSGSHACLNAQAIITEMPYCYGSNSCKNTNISATFNVGCYGFNSCKSTLFYDGDQVNCFSDKSCIDTSYNKNIGDIYGYGSYSLMNTILGFNQNGIFTYDLYGYYSGYNTTIYCTNGSICTINCYGNACLHTQTIGDGTGIFTVNNDTENNYINEFELYNIDDIDDILCNNNENSILLDNANDIYGNNLTILTNLCCRGWNTCNNVNKEITIHNLICSGYNSCNEININKLYDSMYCFGSKTCSNNTISVHENIYCIGYQSCYNLSIINVDNIYLSGYNSGQNTRIYSANNVYILNTRENYLNIISDGDLNVYLLNDIAVKNNYATEINILCNANDTCLIKCGTSNACQLVNLFCPGNCAIICKTDIDNYYCPIVVNTTNTGKIITN